MKRIIFSHGDKGGVGKTQTATRTAAVFQAHGMPLTLVDGDAKNPGLYTLFRDTEGSVSRCNILTTRGIEELFEIIAETKGDVLIDMPAGGSAATEKMTSGGMSDGEIDLGMLLSEIDAEAVVLFTITQAREPIAALRDELKIFPKSTKWIVVKNRYEDREFTDFDASKTKKELEERNGRIIDLGRLSPDVVTLMSSSGHNLNALIASELPSVIQRIRAKSALQSWGKELQKAGIIDV